MHNLEYKIETIKIEHNISDDPILKKIIINPLIQNDNKKTTVKFIINRTTHFSKKVVFLIVRFILNKRIIITFKIFI